MKAKTKAQAPEPALRYVFRDGTMVPALARAVIRYKFADGSTVDVDKTAVDAICRNQLERLKGIEAAENGKRGGRPKKKGPGRAKILKRLNDRTRTTGTEDEARRWLKGQLAGERGVAEKTAEKWITAALVPRRKKQE